MVKPLSQAPQTSLPVPAAAPNLSLRSDWCALTAAGCSMKGELQDLQEGIILRANLRDTYSATKTKIAEWRQVR